MLTRKAHGIDFNIRKISWKNDKSVFFGLKDCEDLKSVQILQEMTPQRPDWAEVFSSDREHLLGQNH